jgi:hypothetical protein
MDEARFPQIVQKIYAQVQELESMFPGRHFTPDGHMLGSLGEALAQHHYSIALSAASAYCHDGHCDGRNVQIKATQTNRIAISSEPEQLLVLSIRQGGSFEEIYNGPGHLVWALVAQKPRPNNGQYQVPISRLRKLMQSVASEQQVPRRRAVVQP